jgi:hypothetical protein
MLPMLLPMILSGVISAGASIFGGVMQASSQDKATKAATEATDKELALKKEIFESNKAGAEPWITAGKEALATLTQKLSDGSFDLSKYGMEELLQDPGYQFRLSEGTRALEGAAAARGKFLSGDQLLGIQEYGQQMASQEFGNAFARTQSERDATYGRLRDASMSGLGAQNALAGVASNYADSAGGAIRAGGQAQATGAANIGNIWANAAGGVASSVNQGIENWMLYDRLAALGV